MPFRSVRPLSLTICLVAFTGLFTADLSAQQPKVLAPHKPVPPALPYTGKWHSPAVPRSMIGGLWMVDANYKSSIYISNAVKVAPITATPILYLSNGRRYQLPDVNLEPSGTAVVNINQALADNNIAPWATLKGYVEIDYQWPWDALCVSVRSVDVAHSLTFTYFLQPGTIRNATSDALAVRTRTVEGLWWKQESDVTGFVSVSNPSAQATSADIQVTDNQANAIATHTVTVSPHGTKVIDLTELQSTTTTQGGVRVTYQGTQNSLLVIGGLQDPLTGFSANMPLHRPPKSTDKAEPFTYAALGLMTGEADPMMRFPAGTRFTPYFVLRNLTGQAYPINPQLFWTENSVTHSLQLPQISVPPNGFADLNLPTQISASALKNFNGSINLTFDFQGPRGALVMASGSVDQKNNYVFEVRPQTVGESAARGLAYWSTAHGDDTMVTLWNPADEAQDFVLTLFFSGGHYRYQVHLGPKATLMLNVSEIIQNQVADDEGNLIPPSVHDGRIEIAGPKGEYQRILLSMETGIYNVQKATCAPICIDCSGATSASIDASPFSVAKGGTVQETFTVQYSSGTKYNLTSSASWSSSNTSVGTVSAGLVTGVSPGAVTIGGGVDQEVNEELCQSENDGAPTCPEKFVSAPSASGTTVSVVITIQSSGAIPAQDTASGAYSGETGTTQLGPITDGLDCFIGYQATGTVSPADYAGTVTLVRTKQGANYDGATGETLLDSYPTGTDDTSDPPFEVTTPTEGAVYDLDAPYLLPSQGQVWRKRINFFENAQLPDGTYAAIEVPFYVRFSCQWASGGSFFATGIAGDNVLGMGTTKTSWNLQ